MSDSQEQRPFNILAHYIKDLSFENPNYAASVTDAQVNPEVAIKIESNVAKIRDNLYEVVIHNTANATANEKPIFIIDIKYASLVSVSPQIKEEDLEPLLLVHIPHLTFPYVREKVATLTTQGGYPALLLDPVDFAAIYLAKKKQLHEQSNGESNSSVH